MYVYARINPEIRDGCGPNPAHGYHRVPDTHTFFDRGPRGDDGTPLTPALVRGPHLSTHTPRSKECISTFSDPHPLPSLALFPHAFRLCGSYALFS